MARLRQNQPSDVAGTAVTPPTISRRGSPDLPPTRLLPGRRLARIIVRPSGTEPKLKIYLEVINPSPVPDDLIPCAPARRRPLAAIRAEHGERDHAGAIFRSREARFPPTRLNRHSTG